MLFLSRVIVSAVFLYPMLNPKDKDVSMSCELPTKADIKSLNLAQFRELLTRFGNCTTIAQHRHWSRHGGYVTLINATPYDWNLTSMYQDQMEYDFPVHIPAGSAHEQYINFVKDYADGTAEATYTLVDAPSAASFSVQARHMGDKRISIQYHDTLSSVNNPGGSKIDLGFQKDGSVSFILSGAGPSFVSSNPPTGWMQNTITSIGTKYLREISMPASHNSGMNKLTYSYSGVRHNTLTQSLGVYEQAMNGARYFDIRPVLRQGQFYVGHFSKLRNRYVGGTGSTMFDIVRDINAFNNATPGELSILDISHEMNIDRDFGPFNGQEWQDLYRILDGIVDLWSPQADWPRDLTAVPLSHFITTGSRSAIIIRLPYYAPTPLSREERSFTQVDAKARDRDSRGKGNVPTVNRGKGNETKRKGGDTDFRPRIKEVTPVSATGILHPAAFVPDTRFPVTNLYSNTHLPGQLSADQINKMRDHNPSKGGMFMGVWIFTENWIHNLNVANQKHSIIGHAAQAHRRLFRDLWPAMSKDSYPNLVQVDNIRNKDVLALTMAININFVSPLLLTRRDNPKVEKATQTTPPKPTQTCSTIDRWAHWWGFYPKSECYNPHPFQSLAKNAQELAAEWKAAEIAKEHARMNNTAGMLRDEEQWWSRHAAKTTAAKTTPSTAVKLRPEQW